MITVINGSDKNIDVYVNHDKYTLGTNMQPLIVPELHTNIVIDGITVPTTFNEIVYCKQLSNGISIAGIKYLMGNNITGNKLYVTNKGFYSCSENGLLNKYFFNDDKKMFTIVSASPTDIRVGNTAVAAQVLKCGQTMLFEKTKSELYIINSGKEMAININEILSTYPVETIVICADATKTTYKTCSGEYDTQDLSMMYITLAGRIYYGGKCVYCPFSMIMIIILLSMFIFVFAIILIATGLFIFRQYS